MTKLCITVAALAGVATVGAAQQLFEVDPGFTVQLSYAAMGSVVELSDGRLLASGSIRYPGEVNASSRTTRLLPSGARDFSFDSSPGGGPIRPWNGKWYVGGGQGVFRLNGDGEWDMSFDLSSSGPMFNIGQGGGFCVSSGGGLLLAGSHVVNDTARGFVGLYQLVWITHTGALDTTRIHRKGNGTLWSIEELPDGKFIAGGGVTQFEGRPVGGIIRVHPDGALDTTFMSPHWDYGLPYTYLPLADGKVLVGGAMRFNGGDTLSLVRLLPNGEMDPAFNNALQTMQNDAPVTPEFAEIRSITPWGPDRYIITGAFTHVEGEVRGGIAMIDTSGYLVDDHFTGPGGGPFLSQVGGYPFVSLVGISPLSSGKYLIYGRYSGYHDGITNYPGQQGITRLHGSGVGMAEHEAVSFSLYPNPATTYATVELEAMPRNGQLVLRDALGREVLRQRVAGYHNTVPLQGLGKGVYLLELREEGTRRVAQRLVVQ